MEKTKVVITLEMGLITVYSDFPDRLNVEVIDLDVESPDYERAEQASQCLERVEIEAESEGDEYGYYPDADDDVED